MVVHTICRKCNRDVSGEFPQYNVRDYHGKKRSISRSCICKRCLSMSEQQPSSDQKTICINVTSCADCYYCFEVAIHQTYTFGRYACGLRPETEEEKKSGNRSILNSWIIDKSVNERKFDPRCPMSKEHVIFLTNKRRVEINPDTVAGGATCEKCGSLMIGVSNGPRHDNPFKLKCPDCKGTEVASNE